MKKIEIWATRESSSVMWGEALSMLTCSYGCDFIKFFKSSDSRIMYVISQPSFDEALRKMEKEARDNSEKTISDYYVIKSRLLFYSKVLGFLANFAPFFLLKIIYKIFWVYWYRLQPYIMLPHATERFFEKDMVSRFGDKFQLITTTSKPFEYMKLNIDLFQHPIEKIVDMYSWKGVYGLSKKFSKEYFLDYKKKINEEDANKVLQEIKEKNKEFDNFILGLKEQDKKDCIFMRELVFIRTDRVDVMSRTVALIEPFLIRVAKKINNNFGFSEGNMLSHKEILDILSGKIKISESEMMKRVNLNDLVVVVEKDGAGFQYGRSFVEDIKSKLDIDQSKISELKGVVAQKGFVKGKVALYADKNDFFENNIGYVFVAKHTMPKDLPYMKKASAIISDEGGITSHTAIVSRELKIPCIIGTKIATKVLKDGDEVEVNANEGIVKIIKRAGE